MKGSNVDVCDWDLHCLKEFKKSFQTTKSACLDTYSMLGFVDVLVKNVNKIIFDLGLVSVNFLFIVRFEQFRTSKGIFEIGSTDLDTH